MTTPASLPYDVRKLTFATVAAVGIAGIVLVVAVLPAEYGIDPTGLGGMLGFSALSGGPQGPAVETPDDDASTIYELRAVWRLVEIPIASRSGFLSTSETETRVTVPIAIANLTSLTATLAWKDADRIDGQVTKGDTLEISIRGPGGVRSQLVQATNAPGEPGNASATVNLLSIPFPQENATSGIRIPTTEDRRGVGNWTFVIRIYQAGGLNGTAAVDPGENWTLTVTGEAYELDVKKKAGRGGDRIRITLAPRQGLEYKFEMQSGAAMSYQWAATAPVYFDLHGDRRGDPDDFVSAKIGTLAEDEGRYVAPFDGRHGWFFRNDGAGTLAVTLETTGDYKILGTS